MKNISNYLSHPYHPVYGYLTREEFHAMLIAPYSGAERWREIAAERERHEIRLAKQQARKERENMLRTTN